MVKGTIAGLVGGLVASWTMNQFQAAWSNATEGFEKPHGAQSMQPSDGSTPGQSPNQNKEDQDDATVKSANGLCVLAPQRLGFVGGSSVLELCA